MGGHTTEVPIPSGVKGEFYRYVEGEPLYWFNLAEA